MTHEPFDPNDWLDRFEAAGGGWYVQDGAPHVCVLKGAKVAGLIAETYVRGRTDTVFAAIMDRHRAKEMNAAG
ncbi:MAG TPA: hypothetical protein VJM34_06955 [Novosphingobium sp.]|nr:hypothetical protein [Novosphingobium sp.]